MASGSGRGRGRGSGSNNSNSKTQEYFGTIQPDLFVRQAGEPKVGSSGRAQKCYANFIPIEMEKVDYSIYQYHVEFDPTVDSKHMRERMLLHPNVTDEIGRYHVFDGMILYLTTEWQQNQEIEVPHPKTEDLIKVIFKQTNRFLLDNAQTINIFNTIIRRCFDEMQLTQLGRHYFNSKDARTVREYNMSILPGYETAIRMYEEKLMLCVENRFKMVRRDSMLSLFRNEMQACQNNRMRVLEKMNEMYGGTTIITLYNNKLHRFTRLDWSITPMSEFQKDGENITLKRYFKDQYDKDITVDDQPIIISEGKPKQPGEPPQINYIVPELCYPTGLTDEMRKDFRMMREIATHTRMSPQQRLQETRKLLGQFHENDKVRSCLQYWGIRLDEDLARVNARVLKSEPLLAEGTKKYEGRNAEWARGIKECGVYRGSNMTNWIVVGPSSGNSGMLAQKFIGEAMRLGNTLRVATGDPMCVPITGVTPNDYLDGVKRAIQQVNGEKVHMLVVLLVDDNKTRYDSLKKFLCVECPIPNQCVNLRTLAGKASDGGENKNFGSIVLKIFLQMICKTGGALWKVNIPLTDTMIVGYDLYHDSTLRGKTVGACVSTTTGDYTQFYSQTRPHENPTQLGNNLTHFVRKALKKYYDENNNNLPTRLILYRDGAGDGQIPYIKNTEVKLVRDACDMVTERAAKMSNKEHKPIKLAFIIVTKRVNMRILKQGANANTAINPEPGTVVDTVVTRPERMDFYLVPQFVNQGTVTPVSYNIIYDDTQLGPDKHQQLAFKLCHLYYNWQGTVRVPAPCQYAHKLAFLTAQSLHGDSDEQLRDKLFFL
uniref:Piwi domain-containing protein n=1 Tax=Caenorhabditis tropicalis TaxID=1561998 RepID=A0A1I7UZW8_9PELO